MRIDITFDPGVPRCLTRIVKEAGGMENRLATHFTKGTKGLRALSIALVLAALRFHNRQTFHSLVIAETPESDSWVATLANAFQGERKAPWLREIEKILGGSIVTATRRDRSGTRDTPARVHFHAAKCTGWEWRILRAGSRELLSESELERLAFDLERLGTWKTKLLGNPPLLPPSVPEAPLPALKQNWVNAVKTRVGTHAFDRCKNGGPSPLQQLLDSIHRLHFLDKNFSTVQPPLPYLPALPLDERWVELRLADGVANTPFVRNGGLAELLPHLSVARFLSLADSAMVVGEPGAGKSTMMKWAARHLISEPGNQNLIPLFVPLRTYACWRERHPEGSIFGYLAEFHRLPVEDFADFMADLEIGNGGLKGLCKIFLDGWDEVPEPMRTDVSDDIYRIQHLIPLVLTSRPSGYVGSLHLDTRYQMAPLSYESMRLLMREWFAKDKKPELEPLLSLHLDHHLAFRELARNPFVLTLLCAITSRDWPKPIPHRKATLYRRLMEIAQETCTSMFRFQGYAWTERDRKNISSSAFQTLQGPGGGCRYEFEFAALAPPDDHLKRTATLLDRSRLITLAYEGADQWSFVHPTVHEFLAAQHLVQPPAGGQEPTSDFAEYAVRPAWLRVMIFVCGLLEADSQHPAWISLGKMAGKLDRFGLMALRLASILSEVACHDGGKLLLGVDIRPVLWRCFLDAPQPRAYAMALVELDPAYVLDRLDEIPPGAAGIRAITLLYALLPPGVEGRQTLQQALLNISSQTGLTLMDEIDSDDLPSQMGFHPLQAHNLTSASETLTAVELIAKLQRGPDPVIRRSHRIRLAALGGSSAEAHLTSAMAAAEEPGDQLELIEALATMGTVGARNSLMELLRKVALPGDAIAGFLTEQILESLRGLPLHEFDARFVLNIARSNVSLPVRVAAVRALSNCQDDRTLRLLGDLLSLNEPEIEVRRFTMETLTKAQAMYGLRQLLREGISARTDEHERRVAWNYVLSCAAHAGTGLLAQASIGGVSDLAEPAIVSFLQSGTEDRLHAHVVRGSGMVRQSIPIAAALLNLAIDLKYPVASRIAACEALKSLEQPPAIAGTMLGLLNSIQDDPCQDKLTEAVAGVLAVTQPEALLGRSHPACTKALWSAALDSGLMVFEDDVVRP